MTRNVEAVRRLMKLTVPGKVDEMRMHLVLRVDVAVWTLLTLKVLHGV